MSLELNRKFQKIFLEDVQDRGIFKAVFLFGGPGSGKDYVLNNVLKDKGLTEVNIDTLISYFKTKDHDFNVPEPEETSPIFKKIKNINELRQVLSIHGRNGLIINGSGDDYQKTESVKNILESMGYESMMIYVHVADEVSRKRNINRAKVGARVIPESKRRMKWNMVQELRQKHAKLFGNEYFEFDNSIDLRESSPEDIKSKKEELDELNDNVEEFINNLPQSEESNNWVQEILQKESKPMFGGVRKLPNKDSQAYQQAQELGLNYLGNGKYGKNGVATHYSFSDNLQEIPQEDPREKKNLKEFMRESIDKGIEPGLSMAASGENLLRPDTELHIKSDNPLDKSKLKKLNIRRKK